MAPLWTKNKAPPSIWQPAGHTVQWAVTPLSKIRKRCLFLWSDSALCQGSWILVPTSLPWQGDLVKWALRICIQRPSCLDCCTSLWGAGGYRLPFQALSVHFPQVTRITHTYNLPSQNHWVNWCFKLLAQQVGKSSTCTYGNTYAKTLTVVF